MVEKNNGGYARLEPGRLSDSGRSRWLAGPMMQGHTTARVLCSSSEFRGRITRHWPIRESQSPVVPDPVTRQAETCGRVVGVVEGNRALSIEIYEAIESIYRVQRRMIRRSGGRTLPNSLVAYYDVPLLPTISSQYNEESPAL